MKYIALFIAILVASNCAYAQDLQDKYLVTISSRYYEKEVLSSLTEREIPDSTVEMAVSDLNMNLSKRFGMAVNQLKVLGFDRDFRIKDILIRTISPTKVYYELVLNTTEDEKVIGYPSRITVIFNSSGIMGKLVLVNKK